MQAVSCNVRSRLIKEGRRDEMKLRQPASAPILKPNNIIQIAYRYFYDGNHKDDYQWCTGTVVAVSNGRNLNNDKGKYYSKGAAVDIQWHADSDKGEEISFSVIRIKKTLFNCYDEFGWRMYFDVEWNNIALQAAREDEMHDEEPEITQNNLGS